jgi:tetratricopeptide (TPR) repeat protein
MILARLFEALRGGGARQRLRTRRVHELLGRADALLSSGDLGGAECCYSDVLDLDDTVAEAHAQLALLLTGSRRFTEALSHYRAAHARETARGDVLESYVRVLLHSGLLDEALEVSDSAVRSDPATYKTWLSAGLAALALHRYDQALAAFERAITLRSDSMEAHTNCGIALQNLGRLDEAEAELARVSDAHPDDALARFHLGLCLLRRGAYATAWPDYEARLANPEAAARPPAFPRWDGNAPAPCTLLVYGEQGLGDEIMFASCLQDLMRTGARCVVECNPKLLKLFTRSFVDATVYAANAQKHVPDEIRRIGIDAEVPLGTLPLYFRRSLRAFPEHNGYLKADPERINAWRARLDALGPGLKIGISWQGGTHATRAPLRSIPLHEWLPILTTPNLQFVSLQYTSDAPQAVATIAREHAVHIEHWPEAVADYDETAALVCALDLTISVCTAVVHLAGALGRPVWVLVPANPEWRYGNAGETMPWYPSARLFRQAARQSWGEVIAAVRAAVQTRFGARSVA